MNNRKCFRRNPATVFIIFIFCVIYYIIHLKTDTPKLSPRLHDLNVLRRDIEKVIHEALKVEKGTGCEVPKFDTYDVIMSDVQIPKIVCDGTDWISECRVVSQILDTVSDIECVYRDIIYENDFKHSIGPPITVRGADAYVLNISDHVKVFCRGKPTLSIFSTTWSGTAVGFRVNVERKPPPPGREGSMNILMFGYDSASRNGFIRHMPKSYEFLIKELKATVLNNYNIVGDGTPAALFPILTGKNEVEMPDVRKTMSNRTLDSLPFMFYKLKDDGYRTAYFEDSPWIGTFQYRLNGFKNQPTDHYLNSFLTESALKQYCIGDTPQYKLMMNITDQFFQLDGKRFCFTFISDISHDNFSMISVADEDMLEFLTTFRDRGRMEDTMLIVMGDHGMRFGLHRDTYAGKLEERLPLMALVLPRSLRRSRPRAQAALESNARVLTTPHDVHATLLDALALTQHWNAYRVPGADLPRGLTLLEPIPHNRSCSEAGIEPHWCACAAWNNVSNKDRLYYRSADAFMDFINSLTDHVRDKCVPRTLTSITWVMARQHANTRMLPRRYVTTLDSHKDKYLFADEFRENYQIKVVVGPGRGVFEASFTYFVDEDKLVFNDRDISRINSYSTEPRCISATYPNLNMYCYCD